jgi:hypothetical protein
MGGVTWVQRDAGDDVAGEAGQDGGDGGLLGGQEELFELAQRPGGDEHGGVGVEAGQQGVVEVVAEQGGGGELGDGGALEEGAGGGARGGIGGGEAEGGVAFLEFVGGADDLPVTPEVAAGAREV